VAEHVAGRRLHTLVELAAQVGDEGPRGDVEPARVRRPHRGDQFAVRDRAGVVEVQLTRSVKSYR
jgi:hypothetical protein